MDGRSALCCKHELGGGPGVEAPKNEIHKQTDDKTTESTAKRSVEEYQPTAAVSFENGMREPGAKNASRDAGKNAALKQECTNPSRRTPTEQTYNNGRRYHADAHQHRGHATRNETDDYAYTDKNQRNNQED
jgi:hypothetical protein